MDQGTGNGEVGHCTGSLLFPECCDRFAIELEFVQNLANPKYLCYLAQQGLFEQYSFINFLKYLRYWKQPNYIRYLLFPQCLPFLDALIDSAEFRREISLPSFVEYVHQQQGSHWIHRDI